MIMADDWTDEVCFQYYSHLASFPAVRLQILSDCASAQLLGSAENSGWRGRKGLCWSKKLESEVVVGAIAKRKKRKLTADISTLVVSSVGGRAGASKGSWLRGVRGARHVVPTLKVSFLNLESVSLDQS